jgi:hypothetical protein
MTYPMSDDKQRTLHINEKIQKQRGEATSHMQRECQWNFFI